ncbi:MAG: hypothetical protein K2X34_05865, partial [Hyphomonadaceae bacterium]|nr:hypothetical protein [Hyphomonadaceae bacterium]
TVSLMLQGAQQDTIGAGLDTLSGFENITGTGTNDTLTGDENANILEGAGGSDTLSGLGGDDVLGLSGGIGFLSVGSVDGGSGTDTLRLDAGNFGAFYLNNWTFTSIERLSLGSYSAAYVFSPNQLPSSLAVNAVLNSGQYVARLYIAPLASETGPVNVDLSGWTFTDWTGSLIYIYGGNFYASDAANADTITGSSQRDFISSYGGADTVNGAGGDDYVEAGNGADTVHGGDGNDNLNGNGGGADALYGDAGNDSLSGGESGDILDGGTGIDSMSGGNGNDTYYVDAAGDTVNESGDGTDTVHASISFSLASLTVENLTLSGASDINGTGNASNNVIIGNSSANILIGAEGDDTLNGGAGVDSMTGGSGEDTYYVDSLSDVVTEASGGGVADTVRVSIDNYTLAAEIEIGRVELTTGLSLVGNGLNNALYGNTGADTLDGGAGVDDLYGGAGNDTYVFDGNDIIHEDADQGVDTIVSSVSYTLASDLENLTLVGTAANGGGNAANNTITGSAVANTLSGEGGDDIISGGGGGDELRGGAGLDELHGGEGDDFVYLWTGVISEFQAFESYFGDGGVDTLSASGGFAFDLSSCTVSGFEALWLTGGATLNITGEQLPAAFAANTVVTGDNSAVVIAIARSTGGATDISGWQLNNWGGGQVQITGSSQADTLIGSSLRDAISGGDGVDAVNGGGGDDTLTGGAGADALDGGAGVDTASYAQSGNAVTVDLAAGTGSGGDAQGDTLTAVENLIGSDFADVLTGSSAANVLIGGAGADQLFGGGGDDEVYYDAADNLANVQGGDGVDVLVYTSGGPPTGFDLGAHGFERAEGRLTDTGANPWATQTINFDNLWRADFASIVNDDGSSAEIDYDQLDAFGWSTNFNQYDAGGLLDVNVTVFDSGVQSAYDYDQTNAFAWVSNWNQYAAGGALDINVTMWDDGTQTSNDFDAGDLFEWESNWISLDALGQLDLNNTVFDNGVQSAYDFDQADAFIWSSNWNQYAANGALDINVTVFDDGTSNSNDFDEANAFNWASNFN